MTVLVFKDKTTADTVLKEIAATPFGQVWAWYDPDRAENAIQYAQSTDGRCAVAHPFSEEDGAWLKVYLGGMAGVQVLDALPSDWRDSTVF